jgi:serine/threonine protein phosphatase PrpC
MIAPTTPAKLSGLRLDGAMVTNVGCVRTHNEDRVRFVLAPESAPDSDNFLLVADGMGGHAAGDFASELADEVVRRVFFDQTGPIPNRLATAFMAANRAIFDHARAHPECAGMGTTCTAVAVREGAAWFAHVGDSRAYLLRGSTLTQLTEDQTLVRKLVKDGVMTEEEARVSESSNVLLQALGTAPEVKPEISQAISLSEGDVLILCTDGLHGLVRDETIGAIASQEAPDEACQALVRAALAAGGHDNVSVGVFRVMQGASVSPAPSDGSSTRRIRTQSATREVSANATRLVSAFEGPR